MSETYETWAGFEQVYLEDSWIVGFRVSQSVVSFDIEAVLTEHHPAYQPPLPGERYCYCRCLIEFSGVTDLTVQNGQISPNFSGDSEVDFGSIDRLERDESSYLVESELGRFQFSATAAVITLEAL